MQSHRSHQHQQVLCVRSRTAHVPAAVLSTCSSSSGRYLAHSLRAEQHGHIHTISALAAGNSISLGSFSRLLQRGAGRQLLPPPAATEDTRSAGGSLQDSSRGGSSRGGGASRGRGRGRGSGIKRSWEGSDSSGSSNCGGVSYGGSQESSWQAQAQHGRGRGGGRFHSAGRGDSTGSDSDSTGTNSSSRGRGSYRGRGRGRSGINNVSSRWVQQDSFGPLVSLLLLQACFCGCVQVRRLWLVLSVPCLCASVN
jgi:hypothetical protein